MKKCQQEKDLKQKRLSKSSTNDSENLSELEQQFPEDDDLEEMKEWRKRYYWGW